MPSFKAMFGDLEQQTHSQAAINFLNGPLAVRESLIAKFQAPAKESFSRVLTRHYDAGQKLADVLKPNLSIQ